MKSHETRRIEEGERPGGGADKDATSEATAPASGSGGDDVDKKSKPEATVSGTGSGGNVNRKEMDWARLIGMLFVVALSNAIP